MVMSVDNLCSEHAMEHPLSAYYHEIAHGAGLIMLSRAYYTHFVEHCPELHDRFIDMAKAMGKTILLVEQNALKALSVADNAYVLEQGRITKSGPGKELLKDPAIAEAYLGKAAR